MENSIYYISKEKEISDIFLLVEEIKKTQWIDHKTIIVNCFPLYSSIVSQIINHKLSYLNDNDLFDQILLELPYKDMSQIFNIDTLQYEMFDRYLFSWASKYIDDSFKYLFISSKIINGKLYNKIKNVINNKADFKFVSLYTTDNCTFIPNITLHKTPNEKRIVFEWENSNNKNF